MIYGSCAARAVINSTGDIDVSQAETRDIPAFGGDAPGYVSRVIDRDVGVSRFACDRAA